MKLLVQTQLSNIVNGRFDLSCDSGWVMCTGRIREMLKLNPELEVDITGPYYHQLVDLPISTNPDLFSSGHVRYLQHRVFPNAIATRYDFDFVHMAEMLDLDLHKENKTWRYDAVYINDPLLLRHYKALFHVKAGYQPRFYVHSHFVDVPSNPKFPQDASLWLGQVEATQRADFNFWQCQTALDEFEANARKLLKDDVVDSILAKSLAWDDGFSYEEITSPINASNIRFDTEEFKRRIENKVVLFMPNRISPSSGDYTAGMKMMFELLPKLHEQLGDSFVLVCGNPNQKFSNEELEKRCGQYGYIKVGQSSFNRNEYKFIAQNSHISLHLYNGTDTYGGTAMRECVTLGCAPVMCDCNEYTKIAAACAIGGCDEWPYMCALDFSNFVNVVEQLCHVGIDELKHHMCNLQSVVRERCSYESTTLKAMRIMGL